MRARFILILALFYAPSLSAQSPPARCLTLYSQPNFQGRSLKLCQDADLRKSKNWQNPGSLVVHGGKWTLSGAPDKEKQQAQQTTLLPGAYDNTKELGLETLTLLALTGSPASPKATKQRPLSTPYRGAPAFAQICHGNPAILCLSSTPSFGALLLLNTPALKTSLFELKAGKPLGKIQLKLASDIKCIESVDRPVGEPKAEHPSAALLTCDQSSKDQQWQLIPRGSTYQIAHIKTRACLTAAASYTLLTPCSPSNSAQRWTFLNKTPKPSHNDQQ